MKNIILISLLLGWAVVISAQSAVLEEDLVVEGNKIDLNVGPLGGIDFKTGDGSSLLGAIEQVLGVLSIENKQDNDLSYVRLKTRGGTLWLSKDGKLGLGVQVPSAYVDIKAPTTETDVRMRIRGADGDDSGTQADNQSAGIELIRTGSKWRMEASNDGDFELYRTTDPDDLNSFKKEYNFWHTYFAPQDDNEVRLGTSSRRWSEVHAVNGMIQTSDARLKSNIKSTGYGLSSLMELRPVEFTWKDDKSGKEKIGLIAQEVLKVIPEVVVQGSEGVEKEDGSIEGATDRLGIYYSDLIPVIIKGMQDQQQIISDLQARIAELEER